MKLLNKIILTLLLLAFLPSVAYAYGAPPCGNNNCHVGGETINVEIVAPSTIKTDNKFEIIIKTDLSQKEELGMRIYFPTGFQCLSGKTESDPSYVASYYETPSNIHTPYSFKLKAPSDYSGDCTISVWAAGTNKETGMFNRTGHDTVIIHSEYSIWKIIADHPLLSIIAAILTLIGTLATLATLGKLF